LTKLSIIIPTSRSDDLKKCLESLNNQNIDKGELEIILIFAKGLPPFDTSIYNYSMKLIEAPENHPSKMRNMGVAESSGVFLGFLDDDTVTPPNWADDVCRYLKDSPSSIIGGPNVDRLQSFPSALANATQEHPLLEGLKNHRKLNIDKIKVNAHNLPLSNIAMTRETFDRIGGFNEVANYFMDGSEFLYIASQLSVPLYLYKSLEIQHHNRLMFYPYFKYKFRARYMIGRNFILFPECYSSAKPIKWVLISLLVMLPVAFVFLAMGHLVKFTAWCLGGYLTLLYLFALPSLKHPGIFIFLAPSVFITQVLMYVGFLTGLFTGILTIQKHLEVVHYKSVRYRNLYRNKP
jgi:GT2 family glycosyltransferase